MYEKLEWKRNPGQFKEWEFGDEIKSGDGCALNDALCNILEKRTSEIFGENGLRPEIWYLCNDDGSIRLHFCIGDDSGGEPLAEVVFPFEKILSNVVSEVMEWSDESVIGLKRSLENALLVLSEK